MIFTETPLPGACVIDLEQRRDERGFFSRVFCRAEFATQGLETDFVQINSSLSTRRGTLRGLHYQIEPAAEVKVVRCVAGALWDVIVDLRSTSSSFGSWFGAELTAANRRMMYVPRGFAHGFLTLTDHCETIYLVSDAYAPVLERGVRWNDPYFGIRWPSSPAVLSEKDDTWPNFDPIRHAIPLDPSA
jgi:dTDP-4-dehydrorhamnose 3,5-epimerase